MPRPEANLVRYLGQLSMRARRSVVGAIREQADRLAEEIRREAPVATGKLRDSVRVRRGRHTLELVVEAGGEITTREVRRGSGVPYDYAMGVEFGNERVPARPFFYPTYRRLKPDIDRAIQAAVEEVLG